MHGGAGAMDDRRMKRPATRVFKLVALGFGVLGALVLWVFFELPRLMTAVRWWTQ